MGTAVSAVTSMIKQVPTQADRMPACAGKRDGKEVKKCGERREAPAVARSRINAARTIIPTVVDNRPMIANIPSNLLLRATLFSTLSISIDLPETFAEQVAADVE